jgi:hypothetical protein
MSAGAGGGIDNGKKTSVDGIVISHMQQGCDCIHPIAKSMSHVHDMGIGCIMFLTALSGEILTCRYKVTCSMRIAAWSTGVNFLNLDSFKPLVQL